MTAPAGGEFFWHPGTATGCRHLYFSNWQKIQRAPVDVKQNAIVTLTVSPSLS
jgi:hypothetical protein